MISSVQGGESNDETVHNDCRGVVRDRDAASHLSPVHALPDYRRKPRNSTIGQLRRDRRRSDHDLGALPGKQTLKPARPLDVEAKQKHVAVLDNIILAFGPQLARVART